MIGAPYSNTRPGSSSSLLGGMTGRRGAQASSRTLAGLSWIEGDALQHGSQNNGTGAGVMCAAVTKSTHERRAA